jgi:receptor protein-tyrosine kinase
VKLREVLAALRSSWWLPLLGLLVGGAAAAGSSSLSTPLYSTETQLFVSGTTSTSTSEAFQGSQFSRERVTSYAQLLGGEELADRVVEQLGLSMSGDELAGKITAELVTDTVLINVTVTDTSPERAQRIAEAIGTEFTSLVQDLETPDGGGNSPVKVTVTDSPELPTAPSSPNTRRNVVLGALFGLLIGGLAAVARAKMDRSVKDPESAASLAGAPVIGTVIRDDALASRHVIDRDRPTRAAEDYRQLRTNLQFLNVDEPPKVIMVSSAMPSEGKTTVTINLALALAEAGRKVTIVDADLRRPRVSNYLGVVGGVGLTNILSGSASVIDVLQPYGDTGVSVIGSGPTPPNPSELLASKHMVALVEQLRDAGDYVLIDAPPLLPVADATGLAVIADGVLVSVRYGTSRQDQLQQAATTLRRVGARTLGLILNIVPPKAEAAGAYGYGYTYGSVDGAEAETSGRRHRR